MHVQWNLQTMDTVGTLVHCREVVPISEVMPCVLQLVGRKQFVHSTKVVRFSECRRFSLLSYSLQNKSYIYAGPLLMKEMLKFKNLRGRSRYHNSLNQSIVHKLMLAYLFLFNIYYPFQT